MILAADESQSFVLFIYGSLEWHLNSLIGFNSGGLSYTSPYVNLESMQSGSGDQSSAFPYPSIQSGSGDLSSTSSYVDLESLQSGSNFDSINGVYGYIVHLPRILESQGIMTLMMHCHSYRLQRAYKIAEYCCVG